MKLTKKVVSVMKMFGLDIERLESLRPQRKCSVHLVDNDICFITGASGSGKTNMLNELYDKTEPDKRIKLDNIEIECGKTVIDCIEGDTFEGLQILSKAGLSDIFSVLSEPAKLSKGEKYRYRLARALASKKCIIFADDFCSGLDRITAAVISFNINKVAKQGNKTFVLASSHDDCLCELRPDVIVIKHLSGKDEVIYKDRRRQTG